MKQEEYEKLWKKLEKELEDNLFANNYPPKYVSHWQSTAPFGISTTDKDAKGMFPYQEPEVDEQGTYYGYKILARNSGGGCPCEECSCLVSPRYHAKWINGELTSDREPSEKTMNGIHCTKSPDHPELSNYAFNPFTEMREVVLVRCALSGTIVETEQGFRAQHALIVGVYYHGNWQSYQDYQKRSRTYPDRNITEEEWRRFQFRW